MLKSSKSNKYCARATRARRTATLTLVFRETVPIRRPRSTKPLPGRRRKLSHQPQILIFDVDGVLVDVRGTYWRSTCYVSTHDALYRNGS